MQSNQPSSLFDVFVVGGGINGVGTAVDAVGRGLRVGLCEQFDLAGAASSASSKLAHGGLRYLKNFRFKLVKETVDESDVLLKMAPHITRTMQFCLPHTHHLRPFWMVRAGLFLYDHLGSRSNMPKSRAVSFKGQSPLRKIFRKGIEYTDAWVDDARLVILNAIELNRRGGTVYTRTRATHAGRLNGLWKIQLQDTLTGETFSVRSRALVNATGSWAQSFIESGLHQTSPQTLTLVKGSHIAVPKIHEESKAYILHDEVGHSVFVTPHSDKYSLIGATYGIYHDDPAKVHCTLDEKQHLCKTTNAFFKKEISIEDILWDFSGVRPLCEDEFDSPHAISRESRLELNAPSGAPPLLSIFGGSLATYRKLGEVAIEKLRPHLPYMSRSWTSDNRLPGSEPFLSVRHCSEHLNNSHPWLPKALAERYSSSYGHLSFRIIGRSRSLEDFGECFGSDLYAAEVDYLIANEWAYSAEDVLWRRGKLGLAVSAAEKNHLAEYIAYRLPQLVPGRFATGDRGAESASVGGIRHPQ